MTTDEEAAERLHGLLMDLVRVAGLLRAEDMVPGRQLTLSQAFALHELDVEAPLTQQELADRLRLEKSSVSRLVADLEHHGLLTRERDRSNRRFYRLRLTPLGRSLHATMASDLHGHYARWTNAMTIQERDALLTGLPALIRVLRAERAHLTPPLPPATPDPGPESRPPG